MTILTGNFTTWALSCNMASHVLSLHFFTTFIIAPDVLTWTHLSMNIYILTWDASTSTFIRTGQWKFRTFINMLTNDILTFSSNAAMLTFYDVLWTVDPNVTG